MKPVPVLLPEDLNKYLRFSQEMDGVGSHTLFMPQLPGLVRAMDQTVAAFEPVDGPQNVGFDLAPVPGL